MITEGGDKLLPLKKGGGREAYIPEKGMQEKAGQVFSGRWRGKNMAVEAHTLGDNVNFPSPIQHVPIR